MKKYFTAISTFEIKIWGQKFVTKRTAFTNLVTHRDYLKIIMFYKIMKGLVDITPIPDLTTVLSVIRSHSYS